jgi:hypothetical protein
VKAALGVLVVLLVGAVLTLSFVVYDQDRRLDRLKADDGIPTWAWDRIEETRAAIANTDERVNCLVDYVNDLEAGRVDPDSALGRAAGRC